MEIPIKKPVIEYLCLERNAVQELMHMLCIGSGNWNPDLLSKIHVDIKVGANQLHQLNIFEINHIGSVAPLNKGSLKLFLKTLHGISMHNLFCLGLLNGINCHIIVARFNKENVTGIY